jgi:fructosamine-3-kinase
VRGTVGRDQLAAALGAPVASLSRIAGGDLNEAYCARMQDGTRVFVKTAADATPGAFAAEAAGLRWLGEVVAVPRVLAADGFLALEWVEEGRLFAAGEEELGRALATLHRAGAPAFGWTPDPPVRLGPLTLPADPVDDAAAWIVGQRWQPLARMAVDRGALDATGLESLCARAGELLGPPEPPARLHGDLWSGNVLARADGSPLLIDPAAHGGPREVDLAMLRLFGGPSQRCFDAYAEVWPLASGHAERVELHQLTPLLVHAVLFGGGYGARAAGVIARYA